MGTKIARLTTLGGDTVRVEFTGNKVSDGNLTLCDIQMQMDGNSEYDPVKYTTASVTCLVDGLKLLELYTTKPLGVAVKITNETTQAVLFAGYVSPNTFDQSINGINDELTIECVDYLGIAKFVPFVRASQYTGFQFRTLADVVTSIAGMVGAKNVWLSDTLRIVSGDEQRTTDKYELLTLSESYFFESITPEVRAGELTYDTLAKDCYSALSMIAESLRFTWVQSGENLYLVDDIKLHADGWARIKRVGGSSLISLVSKKTELKEEMIARATSSISVTPRYSLFSLEQNAADSAQLCANIFDEALFLPVGEQVRYQKGIYDDETLAQEIKSLISYTYNGAKFVGYITFSGPDEIWKDSYWGDKLYKWKSALRIEAAADDNYTRAYRLRSEHTVSPPSRATVGVRLKVSVAFSDKTDEVLYPHELKKRGDAHLFVKIKMGELCYNELEHAWKSEEHLIDLVFKEEDNGGEWRDKFTTAAITMWPISEVMTTNIPGGTVELEIYTSSRDNLNWHTAYVQELSLDLIEAPIVHTINLRSPTPAVVYSGEYSFQREADTVKLPIEIGFPLADKFWGTYINGEDYLAKVSTTLLSRYTCSFRYLAEESVYNTLERVVRQLSKGDGTQIECALADAHNSEITPFNVYTCAAWEGAKAVVGFTKNIKDNWSKVVLI